MVDRMTHDTRVRATVEQVAASGHPVRRRLIEVLGVDGPATASQLAERTGQLVGNVSHHLKMLARAGLVEEVPELAKDRRERWWRHVPISLSWSLADVRGDAVAEAVAIAAENENLEHHLRRVQGWFGDRERSDGYDEAWTRAAFSTEAWAWATPEELEELGEAINRLIADFHNAHREPAPGRESCFVFAHGVPSKP
jgi:DNA-binding transcriptional ArsR family regulator